MAGPDRDRGPAGACDGAAVEALLRDGAGIGEDAALLNGALCDLAAESAAIAAQVRTLAVQAEGARAQSRAIVDAIAAGRDQAARARAAIGHVAEGVAGVAQALRQVGSVTEDIGGIALQTRLVAFNASVEAKRSPEANKGLVVVAEAVKDLAAKVERASKLVAATLAQLEARVAELGVEVSGDAAHPERGRVGQALAQIERGIERIGQAAQRNELACAALGERARASASGAARIGEALGAAQRRTRRFVGISEALAELAVERGVETGDSPFVAAVLEAAARVSAVFGEALRSGEISADELFDEAYEPFADPDSRQCGARFLAFTDRVLPAIQEALIRLSPSVVFCAAVDRNGYLPMYSQRLDDAGSADASAGVVTCHSRRILQDRIGLAAGRNRRRILLQTYRCRTGGKRVLMKDLSAPIVVDGRHWGALRLGYAAAGVAAAQEPGTAPGTAQPTAKAAAAAR